MKHLRTRDLSLVLVLLLSACTNSSPDESVVEPDVAVSQVNGPLSALLTETGGETVFGPLVDAIDARQPRTGPLLVAADQQFDPVSGQTTANPISVYVTASDARGIASVELALDGQSMGDYVAGVDTQGYKNPFIFPSRRSGLSSVPIPGASSGLVASVLRAETENIDGTPGETAVLELQADGSRPLLTFNATSSDSPITTESLVTLTGSTSDSETGVIAFAAFLNGEAIEINPETPFSFDLVEEGLTAGTQTVRLVATNGVLVPNEAVFNFSVTEAPEETDPSDPTTTTDPTDPTTTTDPTDPTTTTDPTDPTTTTDPTDPTTTTDPTDPTTTTDPTDPTTTTDPTDPTTTDPTDPGENTAPTVSLSATPDEGAAPLTVTLTATAEDVDGDTLSYLWDFGNGETATEGSTQTATYNEDGSYNARVTVNDGNGGQASANVVITVGDGGGDPGAPEIDSFTATPTSISSGEASTLAWTITGDVTSVTITPEGGEPIDVTADDDGQLTVSPAQTTLYTINAANGDADAAPQTVTVTVAAPNPVDAVADSVNTKKNQPLPAIKVLANDKPNDVIIVAVTTPNKGGTVAVSRDKKTVAYTPKQGFTGTETFRYTIRNSAGRDSAQVTVKVNP